MELILIRHGQPERVENLDGRPADPPLSALGRTQAEEMAAWLAAEPVSALYVSPLARARQTAAPLEAALGLAAVVVDEIAEYDRSHAVYVPIEELKAAKDERWFALTADGPERVRWRAEVLPALDRIVEAHPGETVAAVCHGGVINAFLAAVLGVDQHVFFEPWYCGLNRVRAARAGLRSIVTVNEAPFLRRLGGPYGSGAGA
ncbi:MAG: histidine phosphatase family protein [Acidimicrobiales bacterium]